MRRAPFILGAVAAIAMGLGTASAATASDPQVGTGRAVVLVSTPDVPSGRYADPDRREAATDRAEGVLDRVAARNDLDVAEKVPEIGMLSVEVGQGGIQALRGDLAGDPKVREVRPDMPVQLRYTPNDFAFTQTDTHAPAGDFGQWNIIKYGTQRAWDLSRGVGAEVTVIDSGADGTHPDLAPRIVAAQAFGTTAPTVDPVGHGTHTAGMACGDTDNNFGIASVGFDCGLFIAKEGGACSDVASAITTAANRGSDVISISLGGCDSSLISALNYAFTRGSVLVVAGDNNPIPNTSCSPFPGNDCAYPSAWVQPDGTGPSTTFDRGLVVTAAKYNGTRASFAQMTSGVSVAAYGAATDAVSGGQQGILSTFPPPTVSYDSFGLRTTVDGSNRFAYLVGTSMATPQVAGLAALIRAAKPGMSAPKVSRLIKATASQCGKYGNGIGWGIVRADQAVSAATGKDIDSPTSRVRSAKRARHSGPGRIINLRLKKGDVGASNCAEEVPASGVKKLVIFASANGGSYHRIGKTKSKSKLFHFHAKPRRSYRFYSIAVDKSGNREPTPGVADAKT